jgi:hypothetical protein
MQKHPDLQYLLLVKVVTTQAGPLSTSHFLFFFKICRQELKCALVDDSNWEKGNKD